MMPRSPAGMVWIGAGESFGDDRLAPYLGSHTPDHIVPPGFYRYLTPADGAQLAIQTECSGGDSLTGIAANGMWDVPLYIDKTYILNDSIIKGLLVRVPGTIYLSLEDTNARDMKVSTIDVITDLDSRSVSGSVAAITATTGNAGR